MEFISRSEAQTQELGRRLGQSLTGPAVVTLRGGLGMGKTAFVRGLAAGLSVAERVTSPTYALVHEHMGRLPLFHFDLYRLSGADEFLALDFDDYLRRSGVCAVEWSEQAEDLWPPDAITVTLSPLKDDPDGRLVTIMHNV